MCGLCLQIAGYIDRAISGKIFKIVAKLICMEYVYVGIRRVKWKQIRKIFRNLVIILIENHKS